MSQLITWTEDFIPLEAVIKGKPQVHQAWVSRVNYTTESTAGERTFLPAILGSNEETAREVASTGKSVSGNSCRAACGWGVSRQQMRCIPIFIRGTDQSIGLAETPWEYYDKKTLVTRVENEFI